MKLISWNVNGLRACLTHGFAESFAALDADIFSVQETKMQPGQADFAPEGYTEYTYSAEKKGYSGTAIWAKTPALSVRYGLDEGVALRAIAPVAVHLRVLYNTTQGYLYFFLLGLAMVAYQQGVLFAVGASALYEAEYPEAMEDAPTWKIMLVKTAVYWLLGMASYAFVIAFVTQALRIPLHAPLAMLVLLAATFLLAVIAFCFFFASFFPAELPFVRAVILYPVPAFIFSGYTWPLQSMGQGMQLVAQFFPLTHFSNTVRDLFLVGSSPNYAACLEKLAVLAVLFFLLGGILYGRRLRCARRAAGEN